MENCLDGASPAAMSPPHTFIQADTTNFRDLVQKLTGLSENRRLCSKTLFSGEDSIRPRKSAFKLQERRNQTMRKLEIKMGFASLRNSSPEETKRYKLESPIPSPATPISEFQFFPSSGTESPSSSSVSVEEKAISEKGFYLHPSPRGIDPPELLTLFPLNSPSQEFWTEIPSITRN